MPLLADTQKAEPSTVAALRTVVPTPTAVLLSTDSTGSVPMVPMRAATLRVVLSREDPPCCLTRPKAPAVGGGGEAGQGSVASQGQRHVLSAGLHGEGYHLQQLARPRHVQVDKGGCG